MTTRGRTRDLGDLIHRVRWRNLRSGGSIEVCEVWRGAGSMTLRGTIAHGAAEPGLSRYELRCAPSLETCHAVTLESVSEGKSRRLRLERGEDGGWLRDGASAPELQDCTDPDLEWSPVTNLFPVRRLPLVSGALVAVRAAWIRMPRLTIEVTPQSYRRLGEHRVLYRNDQSGFEAELTFDEAGLPQNYAGVWIPATDLESP